jgi:SynChlorMet cassette radical SAM/SPASM protein ScmE
MRFNLLSNGGLIDDDIAAFLAQSGRCSHVQISVDGSCAEIHDSGRGKGSFEGAVRGIRTLQRHGVKVAVRVTIHRQNVHDLEATARLLLEELDLPNFSTNSASYFGRCQSNADDMVLTTEDRLLAMETLVRLNEKYDGRISAQAGPLANAKHWHRMERARKRGRKKLPGRGRLSGCGCPKNKIAVRSDGIIVPCVMLAHMELGRINQDPLVEIWQNHPLLLQIRSRRNIPLTEFEFCADCEYLPYCTGNCPGLAYTLTGTVDHPSPDACLREFVRAGGTLNSIE